MTRRKPRVLWEPGEAFAGRTRLRAYKQWLSAYHGVDVTSYDELWRWSIGDLEGFWSSIAEYFEVRFHEAPQTVLERREMPGARWFAGATLSYPEHIFRGREDDAVAIRHASELRPLEEMTWAQLRELTARIQAGLRALGVGPRRPRRGVHAEHRRDGRGVSGDRRPRRGLVELLAGLRRALGDRPLRPDRADGAARGRRLSLRRPRLRPRRRRRGDPRACRRDARAPGLPRRGRLGGRASSALPGTRRSCSSRWTSTTRCGSCTPAARPGCRRRSSRATAGSCSSSSSTRTCTSTCTPATARSGLRRPAG